MFEQGAPTTSNLFYASKAGKLWTDSEITRNFPSHHLSFSKEKRFKWSSIYWPEDTDLVHAAKKKKISEIAELANKISKKIDEEQKNQARMPHLKRSLSKTKSQLGSPRRQNQSVLSNKKPLKLSKMNESIVSRLTQYEEKLQSPLRDRHGNRCNLYEDPQQAPPKELRAMSRTTGFTTSPKLDLDLPHNYFPGPGTYQIKRYLAELDPKSDVYQRANPKQSSTLMSDRH